MAWINTMCQKMVQHGASDLHLSSHKKPLMRIDGEMIASEAEDVIHPEKMAQYLREISPAPKWKEFEETSDTDFAHPLDGIGRFRVNLFMDQHGPGAVLRLIPTRIQSADELGLPKNILDFCTLTKGLVLVTGPTGSGKSTTLAAMIDHINKSRTEHIITIEDPIEFLHQNHKCHVNQREVRQHTASFKKALRAALREDPDIVLVGEMRDLETVEIAIETAETGHLVFGTLHTTTAVSTVDRMIDQFPAERQAQIRSMLSNSLKGVIAQVLCKREPKGRVAALEIMIVNSAIAANIRDGKTHQIMSAMQTGRKQGMRLMNDSLLELVQKKLITPQEAYTKAVEREYLLSQFKEAGIAFEAPVSEPRR